MNSRIKKQLSEFFKDYGFVAILLILILLANYYYSIPSLQSNSKELFEEKEMLSKSKINADLQVVEVNVDSLKDYIKRTVSDSQFDDTYKDIDVETRGDKLVFFTKNEKESQLYFDIYFFSENAAPFIGNKSENALGNMPIEPLSNEEYGFQCPIITTKGLSRKFVKMPVEILASIAYVSTRPSKE